MSKAVIYARYSSERQTEQSIEGQVRVCTEYAEREGITIVNSYIDRAVSGKTDRRPAFQKMIEDSARQEFDMVLVYKLDRFARNRYDSAMYKSRLKKNGVRVISATECISDSPEGIILEGLLEAMNEYYSAELSQKIKRGMRESRLKGQVTGGNVATGYDVVDKRLVINPCQAKAVKIIFDMYCNGSNFSEICKKLNSDGYRTSRNKEFRSGTVSRILRNRHYIGEMSDEGVKNCPAIVDEETFRKANSRLDEHASHRKHKTERADYMLTPKLYCGKCGKRMTGRAGTSKTKNTYYYYSCGTTGDEWIKKSEIESIVIKSISEYLTPDRIKEIARKAHKIYVSGMEETGKLRQSEKELRQTEKAISNLITAIEQGIFTSSTKKRLDELELKKQELKTEISVKKINAPDLKPEHFEVILKKYTDINADNTSLCRTLIESLIDKVIVYPDKIVITLNITKTPDSLETISEAVESSHIVSVGGGDAYSALSAKS